MQEVILAAVVAGSVGVTGLALLAVVVWRVQYRRRLEKERKRNSTGSVRKLVIDHGMVVAAPAPSRFSLRALGRWSTPASAGRSKTPDAVSVLDFGADSKAERRSSCNENYDLEAQTALPNGSPLPTVNEQVADTAVNVPLGIPVAEPPSRWSWTTYNSHATEDMLETPSPPWSVVLTPPPTDQASAIGPEDYFSQRRATRHMNRHSFWSRRSPRSPSGLSDLPEEEDSSEPQETTPSDTSMGTISVPVPVSQPENSLGVDHSTSLPVAMKLSPQNNSVGPAGTDNLQMTPQQFPYNIQLPTPVRLSTTRPLFPQTPSRGPRPSLRPGKDSYFSVQPNSQHTMTEPGRSISPSYRIEQRLPSISTTLGAPGRLSAFLQDPTPEGESVDPFGQASVSSSELGYTQTPGSGGVSPADPRHSLFSINSSQYSPTFSLRPALRMPLIVASIAATEVSPRHERSPSGSQDVQAAPTSLESSDSLSSSLSAPTAAPLTSPGPQLPGPANEERQEAVRRPSSSTGVSASRQVPGSTERSLGNPSQVPTSNLGKKGQHGYPSVVGPAILPGLSMQPVTQVLESEKARSANAAAGCGPVSGAGMNSPKTVAAPIYTRRNNSALLGSPKIEAASTAKAVSEKAGMVLGFYGGGGREVEAVVRWI